MISRSIGRLMTPEDRKQFWQRDAAYWPRFADVLPPNERVATGQRLSL